MGRHSGQLLLDHRGTVWGSQSRRQRPQLRSGSLAGSLSDHRQPGNKLLLCKLDEMGMHTRQYPYPWSIMHIDLHAVACPGCVCCLMLGRLWSVSEQEEDGPLFF